MISGGRSAPTVLVVAYRSDDQLGGCLTALGAGDRVQVIDNDASEPTRAIAEGAGARYLAAPANVGFAAAVNLGLDTAWDGSADVLLLNPDARISSPDVAELQAALHEPGTRRAAVGPRLVGDDGRPQRASWPMPSPAQVWLDAFGLSRLWRGRSFVTGAVLLLNGAALAELGRFDERYFLYAEEADWQMRALRAGWSVDVVDTVCATHVGGASSGDESVRSGLAMASAEAFGKRWYGSRGWRVMNAGSVVAARRRVLTKRVAS